MQTILNTPDDPAHDSLVEKKSEFIGDAAHVDTLDEALAFVAAIREQHPKARHVAYAAVCGGADGQAAASLLERRRAPRAMTASRPVPPASRFSTYSSSRAPPIAWLPSPDISVVFCWAPVGWSARTHPPHHWR